MSCNAFLCIAMFYNGLQSIKGRDDDKNLECLLQNIYALQHKVLQQMGVTNHRTKAQ